MAPQSEQRKERWPGAFCLPGAAQPKHRAAHVPLNVPVVRRLCARQWWKSFCEIKKKMVSH